MEKKNVIFNHTLEQYNKKYKNRNHRLLKYTKKEVEDFDKRNNTKTKNFLLEGRRWWFINNTYYEIPKPIRYTWFRNLNAGIQTGVCVLGAGVVATAITVPTVIALKNKGEEEPEGERNVDVSVEGVTVSKPVKDGDNLIITLTCSDSKKEITDIEEVRVGNASLDKTDYSFEKSSGKLTIKKSGLDKGKKTDNITITPKLTDKEAKIILNKDKVTIGDQGKYYQLKIKSLPENLKDEKPIWTSSNPKVLVEDGKVHTKDDFRGDEKAIITCSVGKEYGICEVTVESTYNIDWLGGTHFGKNMSLYEILTDGSSPDKTAEFLYNDDENGEPCGETADDKIFCSYKNDVIKIWSKKKISFEDDDRPNGGDYGFFESTGQGHVTGYIFDNIDTSSVESFNKTFHGTEVGVLDVTNFNTQNAKSMELMFDGGLGPGMNGPSYIKGLTNFDTSNVVNMTKMFDNTDLAFGCLDLSSFDTSNVKKMSGMFNYDKFNTIYVSEKFTVDKVLSDEGDKGSGMFSNCEGIIGGKNTTYKDIADLDKKYCDTAKYAKLDGGKNNPGFFSNKNEVTLDKLKFINPSSEPYTCEVAVSDDGCKGHVRIPDTINGSYVENGDPSKEYMVTAISDNGFNAESRDDININKIYLTPNIETIGEKAFYKTNIKEIDFGKDSKVKIIKANAFENHNFSDLTLPASLETIEKEAFTTQSECLIERIYFEKNSNLKTIGEQSMCFTNLKYLPIPKSVNKISQHAFVYLKKLIYVDCTEFNEEDNVPDISSDAFAACSEDFQIYTKNQTVCDKFKVKWTQYKDQIVIKPSI